MRLEPHIGPFFFSFRFVCLAICLAFLCNDLHAAQDDVTPADFFAIDSLYRTVFTDESPGKGMGWKPYQRFHWFWGQRAYPTGEIPAGLRWQEWQTKEQSEQERGTLDDPVWQPIGPTNLAGRLLCIAIVPSNPNIMYVGAASGGIWKTIDGGTNWTALGDNLPSLAVGAIAIHPTDPNIIYIGSGEGSFNIDAVYGAGVLKSTDGGATWSTTGLNWTVSQYRAVNKIIINPSNPNIVLAATSRNGSYGGIYRTTNGGATWGNYLTGLDIKDLVIHPDSSSVMYCAAGYPWGSSDNGIYKSTNGGMGWIRLTNGLPASYTQGRQTLAISKSSPTTVYVGVSQTISAGAGLLGVYRTTNAGGSWSLRASSPNFYGGQGWYNNVLAVHPTNSNLVYAAGIDLYKSTDGGATWSQLTYSSYAPGHSQYVHSDHHAFAFHPTTSTTVFAGTDGGLFRSTDAGTGWSALNNGLVTFQFYAMGNSVQRPSECYGGTQDNGTDKYTGSSSWSQVMGGDGGYCTVDYIYPDIVYAETQMGSHYKSTNGGANWTAIQNGISDPGAWVTPVVMDPTNRLVLYTATSKVYRTTDGGSNWNAISSDLYYDISTLAVASSAPNTIYAGCEGGGKVFRTTNTGGSWTDVSAGLPDRYVTRVAIHPTDASTVFVSVSGYGSGHVYKSTNGGSSWSNSSTGLPDQPVNVVVIDGNNPSTLYAGTDLGVYCSTDGGANWSSFSNGLPNVVVDDLALHPTGGTLRAATHGRGMWEAVIGGSSILVTSPNGGEVWGVGVASSITWTSGGITGNVKIELNRDYPGGSWETLFASTANDGSESWTPTSPTTNKARIRVTSISDPSVYDESNIDFSIVTRQITILTPNGGENWVYGTIQTISWSRVGTSPMVVLQLNRSYPSGTWETLATTSSLSYSWVVSSPTTTNARVRAYFSAYPSDGDTSNASFTISSPGVTVTSPNGGEVWMPGELRPICWTRRNLTSTVKVELNRNYPSGTWELLGTGIAGDSLVRTVNGPGGTNVRVRVTSIAFPEISDVSNANFTILNPSLTLTAPNGGEVWTPGSVQNITWQNTNIFGAFNLYLNRYYPIGEWNLICVNDTNSPYEWTVTEPITDSARVKIVSAAQGTILDISDANFRIGQVTQSITVTSPNGGETWLMGTQATITWTRQNASGNATVALNRNYPSGTWETLTTTASGTSFTWTVSGSLASAARVKVFLTSNPAVSDFSNGNFTITAPSLTVTYPAGGEVLAIGSSVTITWTRNYVSGNVTVALNRNYPSGTWENLTTTASGNSIGWTVTGSATSAARIKVFLTSDPTISDLSDANFSIAPPSLTLTYPVGAETLAIGSSVTITWTRFYVSGNVTVSLNRNYPSGTWENLTTTASGNSFAWTVTGSATTAARMKVFLTSDPTISDISDGNFSIAPPSITLTYPVGAETLAVGSVVTVAWTRFGASGNATVAVKRNYPSGTWENLTTTASGNSFAWTVTGSETNNARIRVYLTATPTVGDTCNGDFRIWVPALTLSSPNGGETWILGRTDTVKWSRHAASGNVTVKLCRNYPSGTWETLTTTASGNSYNYSVSGTTGALNRVIVALTASSSVADTSNANFTIASPALTITKPVGAETWIVDSTNSIRWSRYNAEGNVTVQLNRNYPSGTWEVLSATVAGDSFAWLATTPTTAHARVRAFLTSNPSIGDTCDTDFQITNPGITLQSPVGGEVWAVTNMVTIRWTRRDVASVNVRLNRNYPSGSWETIAASLAADSLAWVVSGSSSSTCRIKVESSANSAVCAVSPASFSILYPLLQLTAPVLGDTFTIGNTGLIKWQRNAAVPGTVRVEICRDYPSSSWTVLAETAADSLAWTVSEPATSNARFRVKSLSLTWIGDTTDANTPISYPGLVLRSPSGFTTLEVGYNTTIRWQRAHLLPGVNIELKRNWPNGSWETLASHVVADSLVWTISGPTAANARLRVRSDYNSYAEAVSDCVKIIWPQLSLIYPAGGEVLGVGNTEEIRWERTDYDGPVSVYLNTNYPTGAWTQVAQGLLGTSYSWLIAADTTHAARIKIVSADGFLADTSGSFSIVTPRLQLIQPNGGEALSIGYPYSIQWSRVAASGIVRIEVNRNWPSGAWSVLTDTVTSNSFSWLVPSPENSSNRIRVSLVNRPEIGDTSNANFTISVAGLWVRTPNGGDTLVIGQSAVFRWRRVNAPGAVSVALNRDYPNGTWETLASSVSADSFVWTVTGTPTLAARVRVTLLSNPMFTDVSDNNCGIYYASLILNHPIAGDTLLVGSQREISWTRIGVAGKVHLYVKRNWPSGGWEAIAYNLYGDSYLWTVTSPTSSAARVRVLSGVNSSWGDTTDGGVAIVQPSLVLNSPTGGEVWPIGGEATIRWTRTTAPGQVDVFLSRNGTSGSWESLGSSWGDSLVWTVAGDTTSRARIKIVHHDVPTVAVTSAANHSILVPQLTLISPQGNETYGVGRSMRIRWTKQAVTGAIEVRLDRSGTLDNFETLATVVGVDSFVWSVTGPATQTAAVQLRATSGPPTQTTSPPNIHLVQPSLIFSQPADNSVLIVGEIRTLRWTRLLVEGTVRVELNRTYPSGPWETLAQVTSDSLLWTVTAPRSSNAALRIRSVLYPEIEDEVIELHIISPSLTLVSPNGGEVWGIGNREVISWQRQDDSAPIRIDLNSNYPTGQWTQLASLVSGDSFEWAVSGVPTGHARVRIVASDYSIGDSSASDFSIVYPRLTLTSPAPGDTLLQGDSLAIHWDRLEATGTVRVELARNFPSDDWETIASGVEGNSNLWIATVPEGLHNRIRIFLEGRPEIGDTLEGDFIIGEPAIQVTAPMENDTFFVGTLCNISWQRHFTPGPVTLDLYRNGQWESIAGGITQSNYVWTVSGEPTNAAHFRIRLENDTSITDESGDFVILNPVLSLKQPQAGDSFVVGQTDWIRWSRLGYTGGVNIELAREWPGTWETIAADVLVDSLAWTVNGPRCNSARLRVVAMDDISLGDTTDGGFCILAPSLSLTDPMGGEIWPIGDERTIRWSRMDAAGEVEVFFSRNSAVGPWEELGISLSDSFVWTVEGEPTIHGRVRIVEHDYSVSDTSETDFSIVNPLLTYISPLPGDTLLTGEQLWISWNRYFSPGAVRVELNRDFPNGIWEIIAGGIEADSVLWVVSGLEGAHARIRVFLEERSEISDTLGGDIVLGQPQITVTSPASGDTFFIGGAYTISWQRHFASGGVAIDLYRNGQWESIAGGILQDASSWTVQGESSSSARVRVRLESNPAIIGESGQFSILRPVLTLLTPQTGDTFVVGQSVSIRWSRLGYAGVVNVELAREWLGAWETVASNIPGDSTIWTVSGPRASSARIRIVATGNPALSDTTDGGLRILEPSLALLYPVGGETWAVGETRVIQWSRIDAAGDVEVFLSRSGAGGPWQNIGSSTSDSLLWTVAGDTTTHARVKIISGDFGVQDSMRADFSILIPELILTSPMAGDTFFVGQSYTIRWSRVAAWGPVRVELNRSFPGGSWETVASGIEADSVLWVATGLRGEHNRLRLRLESRPEIGDTLSGDIVFAQPALQLMAPANGDTLVVGETCWIHWNRVDYSGGVNVELAREWPGAWEPIATNAVGDSVIWTVTAPRTSNARMRIVATSNPNLGDTTDGALRILDPSLSLIYPVGGEAWAVSQSQTIRWSRIDATGAVEVFLSRNGVNGSWESIGVSTGDSLVWAVKGDTTNEARIKISLLSRANVEAITANDFTIAYSVLSIIAPETNRLCFVGDDVLVRWIRALAAGPVRVLLIRPELSDELLGEDLLGDSLLWHVNAPEAETCFLLIVHEQNPSIRDSVHVVGPISPRIEFASLGEDTVWIVSSHHMLRWNRHYVADSVRLEMMRDYPDGSWEEITPALVGDTGDVMVELPEDNRVRFRILSIENPTIGDTTDKDVRIVQPSLTLISPIPGARAKIGESLVVRWSRHEFRGAVSVLINRNYPSGAWESIGESSGDSLRWFIDGDATEHARVSISSREYPAVGDTLDGDMEFYRSNLMITLNPPMDTIFVHQTVHLDILRSDLPDAVDIELQRAPLADWEKIADGLTGNEYNWNVTAPEAVEALVRVRASGAAEPCDTLNRTLSILEPSLILLNPAPGETLVVGETISISWRRLGIPGGVRVELAHGDASRELIADSVLADSILWQVTPSRALLARFCIQSNEFPQYGDSSSSPVAILSPSMEMIEPAQDGTDTVGCARPISWRWTDGEGAVRVEVNTHYPSGVWQWLATVEETTYIHIPSGAESDSVRYRIIAENHPSLGDTSGLRRWIAPSLNLNALDEGIWYIGETHSISWTRHHLSGAVRVDISRDEAGVEWDSLATVEGNTLNWTVTGLETEFARFRVTSSIDARYADTMDVPVQIKAPWLGLVEPNGGGEFTVGNRVDLRWRSGGFEGEVGIYLWRGRPIYHLDTLFTSTPNDSIETWTVGGEEADSCYVVIVSLTNPALRDTSDGIFSIRSLSAKRDVVPYKFALEGNYPNPFNSTTTIRYSVAERVRVEMKIYNILGQEVAKLEDTWREPGVYNVSWQAQNYASGMYIVNMRAGDFVRQHKMVLVK